MTAKAMLTIVNRINMVISTVQYRAHNLGWVFVQTIN